MCAFAGLEQKLPFGKIEKPMWEPKGMGGGGAVDDEPFDPNLGLVSQFLECFIVLAVDVEDDECCASGTMFVRLFKE
ncbi:hypothetical protein D3C80_1152480 [compost metagenome]